MVDPVLAIKGETIFCANLLCREPLYRLKSDVNRYTVSQSSLFERVNVLVPRLVDGRHNPCPYCGRTDWFPSWHSWLSQGDFRAVKVLND